MKKQQARDKLYRIALVCSNPSDEFQATYVNYLRAAARDNGMRLIVVDGSALSIDVQNGRGSNFVIHMLSSQYIDGLIILGGAFGFFDRRGELESLFARFPSLPLVSIGRVVDGYFSILTENYSGMFDMVRHMIKVHGCRRLVFLGGPERHTEADERLQGFKDALIHEGLTFNPLWHVEAGFDRQGGETAMETMLSVRKMQPDCVVAANDSALLGALQVLDRHGLRVPDDVKVAGFDNTLNGRLNLPALTTVGQPYREISHRAFAYLGDRLDGIKPIESAVLVCSRMIFRSSCGCHPSRWTDTVGVEKSTQSKNLSIAIKDHEADMGMVVSSVAEAILANVEGGRYLFAKTPFMLSLYNFVSVVLKNAPDCNVHACLREANGLSTWCHNANLEVSNWHLVLQIIVSYFKSKTGLDQEEHRVFWIGLEALLRELDSRILMQERFRDHYISNEALQLSTRLVAVGDNQDHLRRIVGAWLVRLGIAKAYLILLDNNMVSAVSGTDGPSPHRGRVFVATNTADSTLLENSFEVRELLPRGVDALGAEDLVLFPCHVEGEVFAYLLTNSLDIPMSLYTFTTVSISSALNVHDMLRIVRHHSAEVEAVVDQRTLELRMANDSLREISYSDQLTGLKNRRYLMDVIAPEARNLQRAGYMRSEGKPDFLGAENESLERLGLIMVDLDHFKLVNDQFGHMAGDLVLKQVAEIFKNNVRKQDALLRWGGEEFLIVLRGFSNKSLALGELAEKVRLAVKRHSFKIGPRNSISCTCSLGCFMYPPELDEGIPIDFNHALSLADNALYAAKRGGRDQTILASLSRPSQWQLQGASRIISGFLASVEQGLISLERQGPSLDR